MSKENINEAILEKGRAIKYRNGQHKIKRIEDIQPDDTKRDMKIRAYFRNEALNVLWYFVPEDGSDPYLYDLEATEASRRVKQSVANEEWPPERFFWPKKMEDWVKAYWNGDLNNEKAFYISFKKADELIQVKKSKHSKDNALALVVENIGNQETVEANWIPLKTSEENEMKLHYNNREFKLHYENHVERPKEKPQVFRLDPYFFEAWTESEINELNIQEDSLTKPERQEAFKVFKGYIKHKVSNNEPLGDVPYKNLYLVGRMIEVAKENGKKDYGVVILVATPKGTWNPNPEGTNEEIEGNQKENFWKFQIQPWKTNGPDGAGGGGAMP